GEWRARVVVLYLVFLNRVGVVSPKAQLCPYLLAGLVEGRPGGRTQVSEIDQMIPATIHVRPAVNPRQGRVQAVTGRVAVVQNVFFKKVQRRSGAVEILRA